MKCTKSQIIALLQYLYDECMEAGSLENCLQIIAITKKKAEKLAISEFISEFFK